MEDYYMGKAVERIFLPLMRLQLPEIHDICMPAEGIFHNLMLVSMRKSYPGHARKVMSAIWGLGQAMFTKCIVVVDEDVDVQNVREVVWKALNNIDPERDIQFVMGPVDSLDHASRLANYGSKMGVDATRKWPEEGFTRRWPSVMRMPEVFDLFHKLPQLTQAAQQTAAATCNGSLPDCPAAVVTSCGATTPCDATSIACQGGCTTDAQCPSGFFCDTAQNKCAAQVTTGQGCTRTAMCSQSGTPLSCVDAVCCTSA
jgi:Cys-rich repeat protein